MIHFLVSFLQESYPEFGPLRVFDYISVRSAMALVATFLICLAVGPAVIARLRLLGVSQSVREVIKPGAQAPAHGHKAGTPTMGGVLIGGSVLIATILFARLDNPLVAACIGVVFGFGLIGFLDDYLKVAKRNHHGLSARVKLGGQIAVGVCLGIFLQTVDLGVHYAHLDIKGNTRLLVPFAKHLYPELGLLFIPWVVLVMAATSNAVNLTDGLDGLAAGCAMICSLAFLIVTYLVGRADYSRYLFVPYVPLAGELTVILCALVGACMGFLWFNAHPADVFMGDIGSLTIGGLLGAVALMIRQEVLLVIIGGVFVMEALSVILQVGSYKLRGRRIFLMSPLHHHFEKKGLDETRIVVRFWMIAALLALIGLSTLKLR